jgi:hypothetical protein
MQQIMSWLASFERLAWFPEAHNQPSLPWSRDFYTRSGTVFFCAVLIKFPTGINERLSEVVHSGTHPHLIVTHHTADDPGPIAADISVLSVDDLAWAVCVWHKFIFAHGTADC